MQHVAIMKKTWDMIPKIISGQKTIESRWYTTKRAPWGSIAKGDTIYFKNSGEMVIASAIVSKVLEFTISDITDAEAIVKKYGDKICLVNEEAESWNPLPKYCILMFLENPTYIKKPFQINKSGFGAPVAWLSVKNIDMIRVL